MLLEELLSGVVVLELEELWSFERSRGEPWSLDERDGREELRPWALRRLAFESLSLLNRSSDLL